MIRDGCHVIRLRGPWHFEPLAPDIPEPPAPQTLPPPGRVTLPADWDAVLGADFRGRVLLRRRFHRPTGLTPSLRVWLVVEDVEDTAARGAVRLNGTALGPLPGSGGLVQFDVTDLLAQHNELVVEADFSRIPPTDNQAEHHTGGLIGEVRLEIRGQGA